MIWNGLFMMLQITLSCLRIIVLSLQKMIICTIWYESTEIEYSHINIYTYI